MTTPNIKKISPNEIVISSKGDMFKNQGGYVYSTYGENLVFISTTMYCMKIGQLVYVIKDGKAACAIITKRIRRDLPPNHPKLMRLTLFHSFIDFVSCNHGRPLEYEVTYNDNTREIISGDQLEMY